MLAHEKLLVYEKSLAFVATASAFCASWNKNHAVVDQLERASESLVLNLADAARFRPGPSKVRALDYSLGSALECAACFDVAAVKHLTSTEQATDEKRGLCTIVRMLHIAEGNGRYSVLDHHRFLDMAECSAVKVAAYLDLTVQRQLLPRDACDPAKALLERILAMLSRM